MNMTGIKRFLPLLAQARAEPEDNLLRMIPENVVLNKYINNSGQVQSSDPNFYYSAYIPVGAKDTLTLECSQSLNYVSFMEYDVNGNFIKRTLYGGTGSSAVGKTVSHTVGATTTAILWGANPNGQKVTADILSWKWKMAAESHNLIDPTRTIQNSFISGTGKIQDNNNKVIYCTDWNTPLERANYLVTWVCGDPTGTNSNRFVGYTDPDVWYGTLLNVTTGASDVGTLMEKQIFVNGGVTKYVRLCMNKTDTSVCIVREE